METCVRCGHKVTAPILVGGQPYHLQCGVSRANLRETPLTRVLLNGDYFAQIPLKMGYKF